MHLAIDGVGALHGGAAEVLQSFVRAAQRSPRVDRVTVFVSPQSLRRFELDARGMVSEIAVHRGFQSAAGRVPWLVYGLRRATQAVAAGALLCLGGGGIPPPGIKAATLIQQSLPFSSEALALCGPATRVRMRVIKEMMRVSCRSCALVVVQTRTMAEWIQREFRRPPSRTLVCLPPLPEFPAAGSPIQALASMRAVRPDRRLLYVGNDSPYKNLGVLAAALQIVRRQLPDSTLFATVPPDAALAKVPGVVPVGYLSRRALREAYELAQVLVMPSLVETIGLPLLEAMSLGTPVLASDRPYAREVCGEAALFFDPRRPDELAAKCLRLMSDPVVASTQRARGLSLTRSRPTTDLERVISALS